MKRKKSKLDGAFTRSRWLVVQVGMTMEQWCERWGIEPFEAPCGECGLMLKTEIPFAVGQLRGLKAPTCPKCGNINTPWCVVAADGDLFD